LASRTLTSVTPRLWTRDTQGSSGRIEPVKM
jgi:hypothetical protein